MPSSNSVKKSEEKNLSGFQYGMAGATTGTLTRFLVQPLDVLKITFQLQITPKKEKEKAKYTSVFQALRTIFKEEGIPGLWKGHIPAQFLSIIFGAVQFSSYEMLASYFYQNAHPLHYTSYDHFINILCGSLSGLAATVTSFPFDVIKTHLVFQGEPKVYNGMSDTIKGIYLLKGPAGFSKGLTAACCQTVPMSGLVFCFHGLFTQAWYWSFTPTNLENEYVISTTGSMTSGLLAGMCAKTVVYPFDLMKKRLQIQGSQKALSSMKEMMVCKNIPECLVLTVRNEGVLGLFKGLTPTLIKSGATTSLYFTIYKKICQLLEYNTAKRYNFPCIATPSQLKAWGPVVQNITSEGWVTTLSVCHVFKTVFETLLQLKGAVNISKWDWRNLSTLIEWLWVKVQSTAISSWAPQRLINFIET